MIHTLTIEYPPEVLWALQQEPQEFETDARFFLALKLYEIGRSGFSEAGGAYKSLTGRRNVKVVPCPGVD